MPIWMCLPSIIWLPNAISRWICTVSPIRSCRHFCLPDSGRLGAWPELCEQHPGEHQCAAEVTLDAQRLAQQQGAKECRKYGLAFIVASQEARDFDAGLFAAIANYLVLRVTDADARAMARNVASSDQERRVADRFKNLPKFEALFFSEGQRVPAQVKLTRA